MELGYDELVRLRDRVLRLGSPRERAASIKQIAKRIGVLRNHSATSVVDEWASLGIPIFQRSMPMSGTFSLVDSRPVIYVNQSENHRRQRWTAAHEIGHFFLANASLPEAEEEDLCDVFAREVLVPRSALRAYIEDVQPEERVDPAVVLRLCRHFDVNIRAAVNALCEDWGSRDSLLLLANWSGHPHRPDEEAFRLVRASQTMGCFLPANRRLRSYGLVNLSCVAETAKRARDAGQPEPSRESRNGCDDEVEFELRRRRPMPRYGFATGTSSWRAIIQGGIQCYVIAVVNTAQLTSYWGKRSKNGEFR